MKNISADFPLLIPNTHTQCFQVTYTHPDHRSANIVTRFGIIVQNCPGIIGAENTLQPTEYVLYQLAKDYLATPNNHFALLDIFVRANGIIKADATDTKFPATHTIVLWKQSNSKIFVIDPNQKTFSNFIVQTLHTLGNDIHNHSVHGDTFYKSNYLPEPGRKIGYMRDCIDISVKVGFELNRLIGIVRTTNMTENDILNSLYKQFSNDIKDEWDYLKALKSTRDAHSTDINKTSKALEITSFIKKDFKLK